MLLSLLLNQAILHSHDKIEIVYGTIVVNQKVILLLILMKDIKLPMNVKSKYQISLHQLPEISIPIDAFAIYKSKVNGTLQVRIGMMVIVITILKLMDHH